ncbi:MAG TPA: hypothetical protein VGO24_09400, partial [Solirubrobacterales bacterium]|nr:hypothetical protein [Solirubrobacterales bacterium]
RIETSRYRSAAARGGSNRAAPTPRSSVIEGKGEARKNRQIAPRITVAFLALVLGGCGSTASTESTRTSAPDTALRELTIESGAVGALLDVAVTVPGGKSAGRPLLVFLHGAGGSIPGRLKTPTLNRISVPLTVPSVPRQSHFGS